MQITILFERQHHHGFLGKCRTHPKLHGVIVYRKELLPFVRENAISDLSASRKRLP